MNVVIDTDLREQLGQARDQGRRPTCMVFAVSAAHEAARGTTEYLSTEYLYWAGAQRTHQDPNRGLTPSAVKDALAVDGQPYETDWLYARDAPKSDSWIVPPVDTTHKGAYEFDTWKVSEIRETIAIGCPVVIVIMATVALYRPDSKSGIVRVLPNDKPTSRHAMLVVGSGHTQVDRYFLVRNSWGLKWGVSGHGWLPESYVEAGVKQAGTVKAKEM